MTRTAEEQKRLEALTATKLNIQTLVQMLQRDEVRKRDLIIPAHAAEMVDGKLCIHNVENANGKEIGTLLAGLNIATPAGSDGETLALEPTNSAHQQLASHCGIPQAYYDTMRASAEMIAGTIPDIESCRMDTPEMKA